MQHMAASCIPPAPQLLSNHPSPGCGGVAGVASAGLQFGDLSFTFGGQKSLMAATFLIY